MSSIRPLCQWPGWLKWRMKHARHKRSNTWSLIVIHVFSSSSSCIHDTSCVAPHTHIHGVHYTNIQLFLKRRIILEIMVTALAVTLCDTGGGGHGDNETVVLELLQAMGTTLVPDMHDINFFFHLSFRTFRSHVHQMCTRRLNKKFLLGRLNKKKNKSVKEVAEKMQVNIGKY